MEELKSLFGEGSLSYNEFEQKLGDAGDTIKLANLKSGGYVDRAKYEKLEKGLEDYKSKYNALEESTKGFEKLKTDFDDISNKYNDLLAKQEVADKMDKIKGANVDEDFVEFVYSKVNGLTNNEKDFPTALKEYLDGHKQYLKGAKAKSTYVDLQGGESSKNANQKMNDFIRRKK